MIVDCAHYQDGRRQHQGPMRPEDAATICRDAPGFVWLGMVDPSPEELAAVQDIFGLHELAVEDARGFHLRPKVEQYEEGFTFVVLRTARYVAERREVEFGEISIFLGPTHGDCSPTSRCSIIRSSRDRRPDFAPSRRRRWRTPSPRWSADSVSTRSPATSSTAVTCRPSSTRCAPLS